MFFRPEEKSEKWKMILFRINILFFLSYSMCAHSFTIECLRWTYNKFFSFPNQRFYCVKGVKPACLNAHVAVKYSHNRQTRLQKQDPGCKERKFCFKTVIIWNIQSAYKRVCNSIWICSEHQFSPSSLTESFVWTISVCSRRGRLVVREEAAALIPAGRRLLQHCQEGHGYVCVHLVQKQGYRQPILQSQINMTPRARCMNEASK